MIDTTKDDLYKIKTYCDERCAQCYYHGTLQGSIICDYISTTGHRRPCPAGPECTVFTDKVVKTDFRPVINKKVEKACEACGKVTLVLSNAKYCAECAEKRTAAKLEEYKASRRKGTSNKSKSKSKSIKVPVELPKTRVCVICGNTFSPTTLRNVKCTKCRGKKRKKTV